MATKEFHTGTKDRDYVVSILDAFKSSMLVKSACELEIFDELLGEPVSSKALAERKGWNHNCTGRLLDALVSLKLVQKKQLAEEIYGYSSTGAGRQLARSEPHSAWGYTHVIPRFVDMYKDLAHEVKTGAHKEVSFPPQVTVHKTAEDDPKNPTHKKEQKKEDTEGSHDHHGHQHHGDGRHGDAEHGDAHHKGIAHGHGHHGHGHHGDDTHGHGHHGHGHETSGKALLHRYQVWDDMAAVHAPKLLTVFDWSCHKTVVDLGGGSGVFSFELARRYPGMAVTLFEVPPVVDLVKQHFLPGNEDLAVTLVSGDFTTDPLPAADMYLLSKIVHDWGTDQVDQLLAKAFSTINPGGGIVLFEQCLSDKKDGPALAYMWDMAVMAHCAGQLRSAKEYTALLEKHGFRDVRIAVSQDESQWDVIYARKP